MKTAFNAWKSLPSLITLFGCLSETPEAITDALNCIAVLPNFSQSMQLFSHRNKKAGKSSSYQSSSVAISM